MVKAILIILMVSILTVLTSPRTWQVQAQTEKASYPAMASLDQYLISDKDFEVALARSAAPESVSGEAEVMVLGRDGYTTAVKGGNGFLCLVGSWGAATDDPDFWNPKVRSPICFNPPAARTFAHLSDEDQAGAGGKIEDGDRRSDRSGVG